MQPHTSIEGYTKSHRKRRWLAPSPDGPTLGEREGRAAGHCDVVTGAAWIVYC